MSLKNPAISSRKDKLDKLFADIKKFPANDSELQTQWACYLCVKVSGFLEKALSIIISSYVDNKHADDKIKNYLKNKFRWIQSPNISKILEILQEFSPEWATQFQDSCSKEQKECINNIVNARNSIAHGGDISVTFVTIKIWYKEAVEVVELLEDICK